MNFLAFLVKGLWQIFLGGTIVELNDRKIQSDDFNKNVLMKEKNSVIFISFVIRRVIKTKTQIYVVPLIIDY